MRLGEPLVTCANEKPGGAKQSTNTKVKAINTIVRWFQFGPLASHDNLGQIHCRNQHQSHLWKPIEAYRRRL